MNDHIPKPIDPDVLIKALLKWIPARAESSEAETKQAPSTEKSAASSQQQALPEIPGIDLNVATRNLGGNTTLLRKLLRDFYADHANDVQKIQAALNNQDFEQAQRLAHTVKGIAGTIGAGDLQGAAAELEKLLKGKKAKAALSALEQFHAAVTALMPSIAPLAAPSQQERKETGATEPLDNEKVAKLFDELAALIDEMDPDAEEKLAELSTAVSGHVDPVLLKRLAGQVGGFEFDEAQATLQILRNKLISED
jgi:HPt (histidine-containing phosphotransfer) domain-containing protein